MKQLAILLVLLAAATSALVDSSAAPAGSSITPVSGTLHFLVTDPGKQWIDSQGILHIRGAIIQWEMRPGEGDLVGTGWGVFNADMDPLTGTGVTQGFHVFDVSLGALSGSFAGHADCTVTRGMLVGDYTAPHGAGDFEGMKLRSRITFVWGSGIGQYSGFIQNPKG